MALSWECGAALVHPMVRLREGAKSLPSRKERENGRAPAFGSGESAG